MNKDVTKLRFNLTPSMTYTLSRLNDLMDEKERLLNRDDANSYEVGKAISTLNKEINLLKEDFIREFRIENIDEINYYWYMRSKE